MIRYDVCGELLPNCLLSIFSIETALLSASCPYYTSANATKYANVSFSMTADHSHLRKALGNG